MTSRARSRVYLRNPVGQSYTDPLEGDADLVLQWDSSDVQRSSGFASRLNDQSGNGRHGLQDGTVQLAEPSWRGETALRFTGVAGANNRFLLAAGDAVIDALSDGDGFWSLIVVGSWESAFGEEFRTMFAKRSAWTDAAQGIYYSQTPGGVLLPDSINWQIADHDLNSCPYEGDFLQVFTASNADGYQWYQDGAAYETPTGGIAAWSNVAEPFQLGGVVWSDTPDAGFKGLFKHLRLYKRRLTAQNVADWVGEYAHPRWGSSGWTLAGA